MSSDPAAFRSGSFEYRAAYWAVLSCRSRWRPGVCADQRLCLAPTASLEADRRKLRQHVWICGGDLRRWHHGCRGRARRQQRRWRSAGLRVELLFRNLERPGSRAGGGRVRRRSRSRERGRDFRRWQHRSDWRVPRQWSGGSKGAVWVFTRTAGVWSQQGDKLVGTGGTATDLQGYAVAISAGGNTAVVGAPNYNGNQGRFWVFSRSAGSWSQLGSATPADETGGADRRVLLATPFPCRRTARPR